MFVKHAPLAVAISLAMSSQAVLANSDESTADNAELDNVVVTGQYSVNKVIDTATGLGLTIKETPQSVSVLTTQRMEDEGMETVVDTIKSTIGVSSISWDNVRNALQARGFEIQNYQIDGIPMSWSILGDSGETIADVSIYERVEFVRGSTGLLTGTGDPSASINLVRKKADSVDFNGHVSAALGSWNHKEITTDLASGLSNDGTLRGRVIAKKVKGESYTDLFEQDTDVFYGVIEKDLSHSTLVRLGISYQHDDPTAPVWGGLTGKFNSGKLTDWSRSKTSAANWSKWETSNTNTFTSLNHIFSNGWELTANYNHMKYTQDSKLFYVYGAVDETTGDGLNASLYKSDGESEQQSVDLQLRGQIDLFSLTSDVVVGAMYSEQNSYAYKYDNGLNEIDPPVNNFFNWDGTFNEPNWAIAGTLDKDLSVKNQGAYAATRLHVTNELKIIFGGRVSSWERKGDSYSDTGDYGDNDVFVPYAGILYDLNDTHRVYASATEIFKPQNNQDINDKLLDPVTGKTYEAGLKSGFFNGMLQTSASVFRIEQDNLAVAAGLHPDDAARTVYINAEGITSEGFEIEAIGQPLDGLKVNAGYSQFEAKDANNVKVNTNHPRKQFNLFTTYNFVNTLPKLTVGGGVNWQSETYDLDLVQEEYTLVNLMGRYALSQNLDVQLNLNNVLDEKYYNYINYGQIRYGAPANWKLNVKYKL